MDTNLIFCKQVNNFISFFCLFSLQATNYPKIAKIKKKATRMSSYVSFMFFLSSKIGKTLEKWQKYSIYTNRNESNKKWQSNLVFNKKLTGIYSQKIYIHSFFIFW